MVALLLRGGDRDALATLRAATTKNFTAAPGLLAGAEPVGPLAALVVWLVRALRHRQAPVSAERGSILNASEGVKLALRISTIRRRSSAPCGAMPRPTPPRPADPTDRCPIGCYQDDHPARRGVSRTKNPRYPQGANLVSGVSCGSGIEIEGFQIPAPFGLAPSILALLENHRLAPIGRRAQPVRFQSWATYQVANRKPKARKPLACSTSVDNSCLPCGFPRSLSQSCLCFHCAISGSRRTPPPSCG
jgi:hypothetical protein